MNMGAAARALKEAGDENIVSSKDDSANRTHTVAITLQTVNAAPYVHEAVFAAVQGGKSRGTNHLPVVKFCRANRAGMGIAGHTFTTGF
jgi:hypothetical protein